jgi:two-component system, NarL family, invasion response regulator UvrY
MYEKVELIPDKPLSVLLVDDHAIVRQGVKQIIAQEFPNAVFGEAQNADEALAKLSNSDWSVMIVDVGMPGRNGLEVLSDAQQSNPKMPVLVLSMYPERQYAIRALRGGAAGYLTKDSALAELVKAVRKVLAGGKYVSSSLAEQLAGEIRDGADKLPHELLSTREHAVVCALVSGKKASEIAQELGLSAKTVCTYRLRAMEKLRIETNADLVRYAMEHRLI